MDRQLFILDDAIWDSMSFDDVKNTIDDMRELDIAFPPCRYFDIMTKKDAVDRIIQSVFEGEVGTNEKLKTLPAKFKFDFDEKLKNFICDMRCQFYGEKNFRSFLVEASNETNFEDNVEWVAMIGRWVLAYLIVSLAAKNSVKTVRENKLMKLGIGKKKNDKYRYTTTITIGKITETEGTGEGGGWTVRPHLRRGHIREQRYGPNRQYSKKVFIQPVFVNAVEGFIDQRKAYNVRVAS